MTLPLLLVAVAPLMIASFAFNFNNFNNIYLLTGGGPSRTTSPIAGATDILISYTYKLAFAAGKGSDYGLASAVAIIIFFIVASISASRFWRTQVLENDRDERRSTAADVASATAPRDVARRAEAARAKRPPFERHLVAAPGRRSPRRRSRSSRSSTSSRRRSTRERPR